MTATDMFIKVQVYGDYCGLNFTDTSYSYVDNVNRDVLMLKYVVRVKKCINKGSYNNPKLFLGKKIKGEL